MANNPEVTIDLITHATENPAKFFNIFLDVFGIKEDEFSKQNLVGHFDNPITLISIKITKQRANDFVKKLVAKMNSENIEQLIDEIESRVEDSTLHLRLDKNEFVQENYILADKNSIKLKIYTPIYSKKETIKIFTNLILSN